MFHFDIMHVIVVLMLLKNLRVGVVFDTVEVIITDKKVKPGRLCGYKSKIKPTNMHDSFREDLKQKFRIFDMGTTIIISNSR